ncbi:MAG: hypothetical protein ABL995_18410 [Bryobacteraceae bacterium]
MPSQAEHLYKATNNKLFADGIARDNPTAAGWILTALFYSALHYVEAFNAKFNCHFSRHEDLNRDLERNPQLCPIYDEYRDLSTFSWNARYQPVKYGDAQLREAYEAHSMVVKHINALLT